MAVSHCGIGDQQLRLGRHPVCDSLRSFLVQQSLGACNWNATQFGQAGWAYIAFGHGATGSFGVSVDRDVGDVGQDFGAPIATFFKLEQLWRFINKFCAITFR